GHRSRCVLHPDIHPRWAAVRRRSAHGCLRRRHRNGEERTELMDISLISAFIGGILALLSPCAALLLPAFFGSTVAAGSRLILHGLIFYVGLLLVLISLGICAGTLGALFNSHRVDIVLVASIVLIVLGIVQFFGFGFYPARMLPGADVARQRSAQATGWTKTFLLGATSGIAGVCAGPILGAVLTRAATKGSFVLGGIMLA